MYTIRKLVEKYGKYVIWTVVIGFVIGAVIVFSPYTFTPGARNIPKEEDVVLVVNGEKIGKDQYERAYQEILNEHRQFNPEIEKTLEGPDGAYRKLQWRAQAIDRLIERTIKDQESRKRGISVPSKKLDGRYKKEYESLLIMLRQRYGIDEKELARLLRERGSSLQAYQRQIRDQAAAQLKEELLEEAVVGPIEATNAQLLEFIEQNKTRYINDILGYIQPTTTELQAYFEANRERYATPEVKARHILIRVDENASEEQVAQAKKKIEGIKKELDKGADFAEIAKKYSDDKSNAENGGDLGWFGRGVMVKEFEDAAFALDIGKISEPVRTRYGFHLIKVEDKRVRTFEQAQSDVRRDWIREKEETLFAQWLEAAKQGNFLERVRLSRIFIPLAPDAPEDELISARKRLQEAKDKLKVEGASFSDIVREYSQDPDFKDRLGDMGYLTVTDLPKELQEALTQLQVGQLSDLIQTAQGLWLIRLEDRKSWETVKESIASDYRVRQRVQRFEEWLKQAKASAQIELRLPLIAAYQLEQQEKIDEAIAAYERLLQGGTLAEDELGRYLDYYIARLYQVKLRQAEQEKAELEKQENIENKQAKLQELEQKIKEYRQKAVQHLLEIAKSGEADRSFYDQLLALDPDNPQAHYQYGLYLFTAGDQESIQTSIKMTKRATELAPDDPGPLRLYGHLMMSLKNYAVALEYYQKALEKLDPEKDKAAIRTVKRKMAEAYFGLEEWDKAEALYAELREHELKERGYDDPRIVTALADIALKKGDPERAASLYLESLKLENNPNVRLKLGRVYETLGDFEKASAQYSYVIKESPYLAEAYMALGDLQRKQGKSEDALKNYREGFKRTAAAELREQLGERIVELDPKDFETRFQLAKLYQKQHIFESAVRHYTAILEQGPTPEQALNAYLGLGDVAVGRADYEQAKHHYKSALAVATTDDQKKNLYQKILEAERSLVGSEGKLGEDGLEALYQLAVIARNQQKLADMREQLEKLKEQNPNYRATEVAQMLYEVTGKWSDDKPGMPVALQESRPISPGQEHEPYNSTPPTSGAYIDGEIVFGVHQEAIAEGLQVRALRGGAVLIQYGPETDPSTVTELTNLLKRLQNEHAEKYCRLILAPYEKLEPKQLALTAWGRIDKLSSYDESRVQGFIDEWINKGPEQIPCVHK
ncbi:MAG: peptidylprolyl isomerase [Candidatus Bipolaricaulota bacterium]|nr:peptidylprolyl isomerase [Candidatus Bipolaricaulota bacterium]MDW8030285.1 peptidylprolyl isomerase [Candidatus Bipolaricaulota bacterium]